MSKKQTLDESSIHDDQQQQQSLTDALQRERADAINMRRRYESDIARLRTSVKAGVITELLPVIDSFERALKHVPAELETNEYINGIQRIVKQFEKVLETLDVKRIDSLGKAFDPNLHEAVSFEEGEGTKEIVVAELQPGYKIGDEVIRHAMVRVKAE